MKLPVRAAPRQEKPVYQGFLDLVLLTLALPVAWKARTVRNRSIEDVAAELSRQPSFFKPVDVRRAQRAAARACRILSRFTGTLDTCLTRSLVAGALLAHRAGVELPVGFKAMTGRDALFEGHAWITMNPVCVYRRIRKLKYRLGRTTE